MDGTATSVDGRPTPPIRSGIGIGAKLVLATALASGLVMALVAAILVVAIRRDDARALQERAEPIARRLIGSLADPLWSYAYSNVREIVDAELGDRWLAGITVRHADGALICARSRVAGSVTGSETRPQEGLLCIEGTIDYQGRTLGRVSVFIDRRPLAQRQRLMTAGIIAAIVLIEAVLVLTIVLALRRMVLGPIMRSKTVLEALARGEVDQQQLAQASGDEVGHLAAAVNQTMERMRESAHAATLRADEMAGLAKALQQAIQDATAARDEALQANQAKDSFLACMSHELRTPLNAILGHAQMLLREQGIPDRLRRSAGAINASGDHLLAMINDILDLSRIAAGKVQVVSEPVHIPQLIDNIQSLFDLRVEEKGLRLLCRIAPEVPPCIASDGRKLRQILFNLVSNAIKFTSAGEIGLTVMHQAAEGGRLSIAVRDSGPGIGPAERERLFQPFVQTSAGRASGQGTGLGLAISRGYARLLGGDITVADAPGGGCLFTLALPAPVVDHAAAGSGARRRIRGLSPDSPRPAVLVVDDQQLNRDLLAQLLGGLGLTVHTAATGTEALAVWRQHAPGLILMDISMPEMDGDEAARRIRATPTGAATRIIALTAIAFPEDHARFLGSGCDAVLAKPYKEQDLFVLMEQLLGMRFLWNGGAAAADDAGTPRAGEAPPADAGSDLRQRLLGLDGQVRHRLGEAAEACDLKAVVAIADGLTDRTTGEQIAELAGNFAFGRLLELLSDSPSSPPSGGPP